MEGRKEEAIEGEKEEERNREWRKGRRKGGIKR